MKVKVILLAALAATLTSSIALADGQAPTYTTKVVDIVGRRVVPIASVEVARVQPRLELYPLRPGFALGIEASVGQSPF
jgi:hypothetical protein